MIFIDIMRIDENKSLEISEINIVNLLMKMKILIYTLHNSLCLGDRKLA